MDLFTCRKELMLQKRTPNTLSITDIRPVRIGLLLFCGLILSLAPHRAEAQGIEAWDVGFTAGMSNYMGDIGNGRISRRNFIWDLQEVQTRPAFGIFVRRKIDRDGLWNAKVDLSRIHISGRDKGTNYAPRRARNLNFRNHMREASIRIERDLFQTPLTWGRQRRAMLTVRAFLGLARLHHNPEGQVDLDNPAFGSLVAAGITSAGEWHSLPELQTEGHDYSDELNLTTVPFGFAAVITGQKRGGAPEWYLGVEVGFRLTNTDYLDDISAFYADPSEMSDLGAALSAQSNDGLLEEIGPDAGSITAHSYISDDIPVTRGNPVNNDAYGTLVVSFGKVLERGNGGFSRNRSRYGNKRRGSPFKRRTRTRF